MFVPEIPQPVASQRPDLVVTNLLRHALGATWQTLATLHPGIEFQASFDAREPQERLAMRISVLLRELERSLADYHEVVDAELYRVCDSDSLPF